MAEARWWQAVLPSPPACTAGGPAMDPASRPELQHPIHHWSLPQHVVCMPMCSRRLHSASRVDDLQHRIRGRLHFCSTAAYRLEALDKLNPMDRTQAREKRVITRASCEVAFASVAAWSRSWCQNACVLSSQNARTLSKSEYAVSLVHYSRPLNRQETIRFCKSHDPQFR